MQHLLRGGGFYSKGAVGNTGAEPSLYVSSGIRFDCDTRMELPFTSSLSDDW